LPFFAMAMKKHPTSAKKNMVKSVKMLKHWKDGLILIE
jgi:hypothetical protein